MTLPLLAAADVVGVNIGAGTNVVIESANEILVKSNPKNVPIAIGFSKKTCSKMVQNLWWATGLQHFRFALGERHFFVATSGCRP